MVAVVWWKFELVEVDCRCCGGNARSLRAKEMRRWLRISSLTSSQGRNRFGPEEVRRCGRHCRGMQIVGLSACRARDGCSRS